MKKIQQEAEYYESVSKSKNKGSIVTNSKQASNISEKKENYNYRSSYSTDRYQRNSSSNQSATHNSKTNKDYMTTKMNSMNNQNILSSSKQKFIRASTHSSKVGNLNQLEKAKSREKSLEIYSKKIFENRESINFSDNSTNNQKSLIIYKDKEQPSYQKRSIFNSKLKSKNSKNVIYDQIEIVENNPDSNKRKNISSCSVQTQTSSLVTQDEIENHLENEKEKNLKLSEENSNLADIIRTLREDIRIAKDLEKTLNNKIKELFENNEKIQVELKKKCDNDKFTSLSEIHLSNEREIQHKMLIESMNKNSEVLMKNNAELSEQLYKTKLKNKELEKENHEIVLENEKNQKKSSLEIENLRKVINEKIFEKNYEDQLDRVQEELKNAISEAANYKNLYDSLKFEKNSEIEINIENFKAELEKINEEHSILTLNMQKLYFA